MRALGLTGAGPGRTVRTTRPAAGNRVPDDLLHRDFTAARPDRRWVVDFTHVPTRSGFCYTAFVTGPVLPPHRRLGHRQPHEHRLRARRPGAGDLDAQGPRGRRPPGAWCTTATTDLSTCPSPTPDDSSTRASRHPPEPWVPPTRAPPPRPRASPCKRGARSGATTPGEGPRRPPGPPPPDR